MSLPDAPAAPMTAVDPGAETAPPKPASRAVELTVRVAGCVISVLAAFFSGVHVSSAQVIAAGVAGHCHACTCMRVTQLARGAVS